MRFVETAVFTRALKRLLDDEGRLVREEFK